MKLPHKYTAQLLLSYINDLKEITPKALALMVQAIDEGNTIYITIKVGKKNSTGQYDYELRYSYVNPEPIEKATKVSLKILQNQKDN